MIIHKQYLVSFFLVPLLSWSGSVAQSEANLHKKYNLAQALLQIEKRYHGSIIGELAEPIPQQVSIDESTGLDEQAALAAIASQCPGYIWHIRKGVVIFGDEKLLRSDGNPMNVRLPAYTIPSSLSEFKLTFPAAVESVGITKNGIGGLVTGIGLPDNISPRLNIREVKNTKAREILIDVATEANPLFSILILPSNHPTKLSLDNKGFLLWDLAAGPGLAKYETYVTRIP